MEELRFCQIAANEKGLFGLSDDGAIYRYVPAGEGANRYAFWTRLTTKAAESGRQRQANKEAKQLDLLADQLLPLLVERLKEGGT